MAFSGFLFICWRIFEVIMLIPPMGMLAWFVNGYVSSNELTPNFVLVLFITTVLALAWAVATLFNYLRARHDALFVALVDLGFFGALIAGVVVLRFISNANCNDFTADPSFRSSLGAFGYFGYLANNGWASNPSKTCNVLKASFAFGIINVIAFFVTFLLALLVHRNHRDDNKVVVRREYHTSRHSHRRSGSRDYRSSSRNREYRGSRDYDSRPRSSAGAPRKSSSRPAYRV